MSTNKPLLSYPKTNDLGLAVYRRLSLAKLSRQVSDFLQKHYQSITCLLKKHLQAVEVKEDMRVPVEGNDQDKQKAPSKRQFIFHHQQQPLAELQERQSDRSNVDCSHREVQVQSKDQKGSADKQTQVYSYSSTQQAMNLLFTPPSQDVEVYSEDSSEDLTFQRPLELSPPPTPPNDDMNTSCYLSGIKHRKLNPDQPSGQLLHRINFIQNQTPSIKQHFDTLYNQALSHSLLYGTVNSSKQDVDKLVAMKEEAAAKWRERKEGNSKPPIRQIKEAKRLMRQHKRRQAQLKARMAEYKASQIEKSRNKLKLQTNLIQVNLQNFVKALSTSLKGQGLARLHQHSQKQKQVDNRQETRQNESKIEVACNQQAKIKESSPGSCCEPESKQHQKRAGQLETQVETEDKRETEASMQKMLLRLKESKKQASLAEEDKSFSQKKQVKVNPFLALLKHKPEDTVPAAPKQRDPPREKSTFQHFFAEKLTEASEKTEQPKKQQALTPNQQQSSPAQQQTPSPTKNNPFMAAVSGNLPKLQDFITKNPAFQLFGSPQSTNQSSNQIALAFPQQQTDQKPLLQTLTGSGFQTGQSNTHQANQFSFFQGNSNPVSQNNHSFQAAPSMAPVQTHPFGHGQPGIFQSNANHQLAGLFADPLKSRQMFESNPFLQRKPAESQPQSLFNPTVASKPERSNSNANRSAASRKARKNEVRIS